MDEVGRPAQVATKYVTINLCIPVAESLGWEGMTEDEIDATLEQIARVTAYAAGMIEAVLKDPSFLPLAFNIARTSFDMIAAEHEERLRG